MDHLAPDQFDLGPLGHRQSDLPPSHLKGIGPAVRKDRPDHALAGFARGSIRTSGTGSNADRDSKRPPVPAGFPSTSRLAIPRKQTQPMTKRQT